jgi:HAE1 family hydrophobic/amphiphilic exporter-1
LPASLNDVVEQHAQQHHADVRSEPHRQRGVDVQTAIAAATPLLPPTLTAPPSFRKVNPADQPILNINLTSDTLDMTAVTHAEDILAPDLDGERRLRSAGLGPHAVRIQWIRISRRLSDRHDEVNAALQNWNVTEPTGQLFDRTRRPTSLRKGSSTTLTNSGRLSCTATAARAADVPT